MTTFREFFECAYWKVYNVEKRYEDILLPNKKITNKIDELLQELEAENTKLIFALSLKERRPMIRFYFFGRKYGHKSWSVQGFGYGQSIKSFLRSEKEDEKLHGQDRTEIYCIHEMKEVEISACPEYLRKFAVIPTMKDLFS